MFVKPSSEPSSEHYVCFQQVFKSNRVPLEKSLCRSVVHKAGRTGNLHAVPGQLEVREEGDKNNVPSEASLCTISRGTFHSPNHPFLSLQRQTLFIIKRKSFSLPVVCQSLPRSNLTFRNFTSRLTRLVEFTSARSHRRPATRKPSNYHGHLCSCKSVLANVTYDTLRRHCACHRPDS